jgi:hypothetical protein
MTTTAMTTWTVYGVGALVCVGLAVVVWYVYSERCVVLKRYALQYGTVEIVDPTCQEGLPHTWSPSIIRMTGHDWESSRRDDILRHERVHLRQRREPAAWREFYRTAWGYELTTTPPPGIPEHWVSRLRPNPDTADGPWAVWRGRYVFFPTHRDAKRTLRDAVVQVWDSVARRIVDPPPEWKQQFCEGGHCPHQYEHPHEIAAEFITHADTSEGSAAPAALQLAAAALVKQ